MCPGSCTDKSHFCCETCLVTWAKQHATCPICRSPFTTIVTSHGYVLAQKIHTPAVPVCVEDPDGMVQVFVRAEAATHEVIETPHERARAL